MRALMMTVASLAIATWAKGAGYVLGVDSLPQEGVPKGTVTEHVWEGSRIYPGTTHDYWVYVPAQYTHAEPAAVMVFQDGQAYVTLERSVRAPTVFDNLIHKGEMPVTIGVFINPGRREEGFDQRSAQYVPIDDTYARFLLEEILPEVGKDYSLVDDAQGRAICGMSDGGLAAFTAAWHRPDAFSKVVSQIGSYTRLRGGSEYPYLIRKTRDEPKPIRVFIQGGMNDLNLTEGSWTLANLNMASALMFARYDHRVEIGDGGHDLVHGGAIFPDTMRWIWRDYPGVKGADDAPSLDAVVGEWDVVTKVLGKDRNSVLTITADDGALAATINDEQDGEIQASVVDYDGGALIYKYVEPVPEWVSSKDGDWKDVEWTGRMAAWLRVTGDTFEGAVGSEDKPLDYSVKGRRRASRGD